MKKSDSISAINPRAILRPYKGQALYITATNTDVGKTTVTAALAAALHRQRVRVGVCKPVASGCTMMAGQGGAHALGNDDLWCSDAEMVLRAAGLDPNDPVVMRYASPVRYAIPVSPHVAARMEDRPVNWQRIRESLDYWEENCDLLLVEGAGGWLVPLDDQGFTLADMITILRMQVLVVTNVAMGTINYTNLTLQSIRQRGLVPTGIVINQVPEGAGMQGPGALISGAMLAELPRMCDAPVRAILPQLPKIPHGEVPERLVDLMAPFAAELWQRSGTSGS